MFSIWFISFYSFDFVKQETQRPNGIHLQIATKTITCQLLVSSHQRNVLLPFLRWLFHFLAHPVKNGLSFSKNFDKENPRPGKISSQTQSMPTVNVLEPDASISTGPVNTSGRFSMGFESLRKFKSTYFKRCTYREWVSSNMRFGHS